MLPLVSRCIEIVTWCSVPVATALPHPLQSADRIPIKLMAWIKQLLAVCTDLCLEKRAIVSKSSMFTSRQSVVTCTPGANAPPPWPKGAYS